MVLFIEKQWPPPPKKKNTWVIHLQFCCRALTQHKILHLLCLEHDECTTNLATLWHLEHCCRFALSISNCQSLGDSFVDQSCCIPCPLYDCINMLQWYNNFSTHFCCFPFSVPPMRWCLAFLVIQILSVKCAKATSWPKTFAKRRIS